MTTPPLLPRTDLELARLAEVVFALHAVAAGVPVAADDLVPAVRYGLVHAQRPTGVRLTPRGLRVLAIAHGEIAVGMD